MKRGSVLPPLCIPSVIGSLGPFGQWKIPLQTQVVAWAPPPSLSCSTSFTPSLFCFLTSDFCPTLTALLDCLQQAHCCGAARPCQREWKLGQERQKGPRVSPEIGGGLSGCWRELPSGFRSWDCVYLAMDSTSWFPNSHTLFPPPWSLIGRDTIFCC